MAARPDRSVGIKETATLIARATARRMTNACEIAGNVDIQSAKGAQFVRIGFDRLCAGGDGLAAPSSISELVLVGKDIRRSQGESWRVLECRERGIRLKGRRQLVGSRCADVVGRRWWRIFSGQARR